MKRKLTVITDDKGEVVVTQLGHGDAPDPIAGILVSVVAGPRQRAHKIEFDVPDRMTTSQDVEAFHRVLTEHVSKQ